MKFLREWMPLMVIGCLWLAIGVFIGGVIWVGPWYIKIIFTPIFIVWMIAIMAVTSE